jgi:purine-binding chemotaxis protein CheW
MSENPTASSTDDPLNADVQKALLAAFGDDAMNWLAEDDAEQDLLAAETATEPGPTEEAPQTRLNDLLEQISSAIEGNGPAEPKLNSQNEDEFQKELRTDAGPRHVVFKVGDQQYGIPLDGVLEIDRCGKVTTLPRTPSWLRGVTNLRGQILSVTDFRKLLRLTDQRQSVGEKIIVVHSERLDASTALVVDRVLGIRNLSGERGPLEGLSDRMAVFANSLAVTDQTTTVLIDPDRLLGCDELASFTKE